MNCTGLEQTAREKKDTGRQVRAMYYSAKSVPANGRLRPGRQPRLRPLTINTAPDLVAAQLMGDNNGLALPQLSGIPAEHLLVTDAQSVIPLAANLVRLNIAPPDLWRDAKHDPMAYIELALAHWIKTHGGEQIRRRFTYHSTLTSSLDEFAQEEEKKRKHLYLTLDTESAGYAVLGPTFDILETLDRRLPQTFFNLFVGGLSKWIRVYDYRDAEERAEMYREMCQGEQDSEEYEFPDVAGCLPACMKEAHLGKEDLSRVRRELTLAPAGQLIDQAMEIERISERAIRPTLSDDMRAELSDANPPVPGLLAVFSPSDAVEACFEEEAQYALETPPEPNLIIPFGPDNARSVQAAFHIFGTVCDVLAASVRLLDMMPGNSEWVVDG